MTPRSDPHLWRLAAAGDTDAFGELYERHDLAVRSYCLWRTGDPSATDDLTSIVFLEAWRRRAALPLRTETARPLLLAIARNVIHHRWRSARRHRAALERLSRVDAPRPDHGDDAVDRLAAVERLRAVRGALAALPEREREVLGLIALSELSYEEAAAVLGLPIGTVRSRLSRARARISAADAPAALLPDPEPPQHRDPPAAGGPTIAADARTARDVAVPSAAGPPGCVPAPPPPRPTVLPIPEPRP